VTGTIRRWGLAALALFLPSSVHAQTRLPDGFVHLRAVDASIAQDVRYATADNFTGRPLPGYQAGECILKRPVAEALKRVQADLAQRNLSLKVYDCYRPARAVAAMARWAGNPRTMPDTSRFYPNIDKSKLFTLGYISRASAHSRGVALDLTVVPKGSQQPRFDAAARYGSCTEPTRAPDNSLDMGTGYDCFDSKSYTRDASISAEQRANRMILLEAMGRRGFVNYKREWWHFSFAAADTRVSYDFTVERY
jgi:D-alanyl-D-alanine dipeptidase